MDFTKQLFRCSSLGKIMTGANLGLTENQEKMLVDYDLRYKGEGRPLTEKQQGVFADLLNRKKNPPVISKTTESYLDQVFKEVVFGRSKELTNKYVSKGLSREEHSFTLASDWFGKLLLKNKKRFNNKFITGEPDYCKNIVIDIKTSWDFQTFPLGETKLPSQDYYWQMQGYMALTGLRKAQVVYCLVDTPEPLINDELFRTAKKAGLIDLPLELEAEVYTNMTYEDIDPKLRVSVFEIEYSQKDVENIYKQVEACRDYLNKKFKKVEQIKIAV